MINYIRKINISKEEIIMAKRKSELTAKKVTLFLAVTAIVAFLVFLAYVILVPMLPVDLIDQTWYVDLVNHASELKESIATDAGFWTAIAIFVVAGLALFAAIKKALTNR